MSHQTTPRRPLPLRAEVRRQLRRRRTRLSFGFLVVLPLLLVGAFALGSDDSEGGTSFVDLAQVGPANLAVFAMFASAGFLLVVLVALFAGDAVPSEASWSTLRYLLAAPVPRGRLLRVKLTVALATTLAALVLLPAWSMLVGLVAYGTEAYQGPTGEQLTWAETGLRLAVAVGYLFVSLLFVSSLAVLIGVLTDAPLGAVGGAVLITIVSNILDTISPLGRLREALPTHEQFAWAEALQRDIEWSGMASGALWSVGYSVVLLTAAFVLFQRKDVLS